jgi:predicted acylesterase/phospholipase RssA
MTFFQLQPRVAAGERRLPFERVALVLQGGGALGAYHPPRACDGERRVAARLPRDRDRGRALLGRRSRLEYTAAMGGGRRASPRHVGLSSRPVERARRISSHHVRSHHARKGNPLLQPHARRHRSVQAPAEASIRPCRSAGKLPQDLQSSPEAQLLGSAADRTVYKIVHLIYRARTYEGHSKDYEFSRLSMEEHWRAGYRDAQRTLRHSEVPERPTCHEGVFAFDLHGDGRD